MNLDSFYLAGHSIGGGIAVRYAVKFRHKVRKLVLVNSMGIGKELSPLIRLTSHSFLCRTFGVATARIVKAGKHLIGTFFSNSGSINPLPLAMVLLGASVVIFRQESDSWVSQLAAMMIPTMLIWGARDKIVPVSNAYKAAEKIPDCRLHVFQDGGHNVHSNKAEEFGYLLHNFLM